jgi:hypothetical protein
MLAARPSPRPDDDLDAPELPRPNPADWLPLQQAACELGLSVSTVRRRIRRGLLRNRIVPRRGGFAYLVCVPNSRHAHGLTNGTTAHGARADGAPHACGPDAAPVSLDEYRRNRAVRNGHADANGHDARDDVRDAEIRTLQAQVDHLAGALSRALRTKQRALPAGIGAPGANPADPYARYRWLARRRLWWPF